MVKNYESHKDEIIRLYKDNNVDDLVLIMKERGFTASRRWYLSMFADWGCQKTSNRKPIQKRKRAWTPVENVPEENAVEAQPPNNSSPLNDVSSKSEVFIEKCPYPSCTSGPFASVQVYLDHRAAHRALIWKSMAWDGPTRPLASALEDYLRLREVPYTRKEVEFMKPDLYRRVFQMESCSITQLDVVECLEVLLDTGRYQAYSQDPSADVNVCSIKAILSDEVDFSGAERSLKLLLEAITLFFEGSDEGLESGYPTVIEWLYPLNLSCENWKDVKDNLYTLRNDLKVLPPFDKYIPTFIVQNYIRWLQTKSIAVPASFEMEILTICEELDISLDVKYLLIVQKLPKESENQPPFPESSVSDVPSHGELSQVDEAIHHYHYHYQPPSTLTTSQSLSAHERSSSTPYQDRIDDVIDLEFEPAARNDNHGRIQEDHSFKKSRCPHPECGKLFKDLKRHLIIHRDDRPRKCPVLTCDYHTKGFARRYDRNRHALTHYAGTMLCNFCLSGAAPKAAFNRVDFFKRHLMLVHAAVSSLTPSDQRNTKPSHKSASFLEDDYGKCSTCSVSFETPQDFYEHLDACIMSIIVLGRKLLPPAT